MKKIFLLLTAVLTAGMLSAETIYGDCGTNMEWEFNTGSGALFLIGSGPMDDYNSFDETPWAQYGDQIKSIQKDSRSQYTTIGDYAFFGCQNLTSVDLPNSVTSIGDDAFYGCSDLTSVTIPNSVTSIGNYAFYYCVGLTSVTIPNSVTSIGDDAFYDCSSLASINIPESVTEIKMLAFFYCSSLTSIVIPEGTKSLFETFKGCESLSSVVIPASVTSLTFNTFGGCVSLKEITNYATTPQSVEEDVFDQVDKANCKLYVPSSAVEAYKATEVWKDFDIQAAQGIEDIVVPTGEAQKILMNGVLLIERNGKTYNAQGAEVR